MRVGASKSKNSKTRNPGNRFNMSITPLPASLDLPTNCCPPKPSDRMIYDKERKRFVVESIWDWFFNCCSPSPAAQLQKYAEDDRAIRELQGIVRTIAPLRRNEFQDILSEHPPLILTYGLFCKIRNRLQAIPPRPALPTPASAPYLHRTPPPATSRQPSPSPQGAVLQSNHSKD